MLEFIDAFFFFSKVFISGSLLVWKRTVMEPPFFLSLNRPEIYIGLTFEANWRPRLPCIHAYMHGIKETKNELKAIQASTELHIKSYNA
jgi:hypothetical protein